MASPTASRKLAHLQLRVKLACRADLRWIVAEGTPQREELGFLSRQAVAEKVRLGQVLVAWARQARGWERAGFVLFGSLRRDEVSLFQTFVTTAWRGEGIGRQLVGSVGQLAGTVGVRRLRARCRESMAANGFWAQMGFRFAGTRPGGRSRGERLRVWVKRL